MTEYGMLVGYNPNPGTGIPTNETLTDFHAGIDDMAAQGVTWIRIGTTEYILNQPLCTATNLVWDTAYLAQIDTAISYAVSKGMKIDFFMPLPTAFTATYSQADYLSVVDMYCDFLAAHYAGQIGLWTVNNEGNLSDYRNLGRSVTTSAYRNELATTLSRARTKIRLHDFAPVTHDVASSAAGTLDSSSYSNLLVFLDAIMPSLDAISLHNYTTSVASSYIAALPVFFSDMQVRYGKPLYLTEFGMFSYVAGQTTYTEQLQADSITAMVNAMSYATPPPLVAILYRLKDPTVGLLPAAKGPPVIINDPGLYASPPTGVVFSGGSGAGAAGGGTATVQTAFNGTTGYIVTGVTLTNAGMYAFPPTVTFTGGAIGAGHAAVATAILESENLGIENADGSHKRGYDAFFAAAIPNPPPPASDAVSLSPAKTGRLVFHFYAPRTYPAPYGNASPVASIVGHITAMVTMTQANAFDGHSVEFDDGNRELILGLSPFSTCLIEQRDPLGLTTGFIGWGVIDDPTQRIADSGEGTFTFDMPNITAESLDLLTGIGYIDEGALHAVVADLGSLTQKGESVFTDSAHPRDATGLAVTTTIPGVPTGWSAHYLSDGTLTTSAAPVRWTGVGGAVVDGNSVTRSTQTGVTYDAGAYGTPGFTIPGHNSSLQWQIVAPTTAVCGVTSSPGYNAITYGFQTTESGWQVVADGFLVPGGTGSYQPNSTFRVEFVWAGNVAECNYYVADALVFQHSAFGPFWPIAQIVSPGGAIDNAIFTGVVDTGDLWWQVRFDKQTQVGALIQLAQDTGMYVRQAQDAVGQPLRAYELGPMSAAPTMRLIDGRGGDTRRMRANEDIRLIKEITEYHRGSVRNCVTVTTPLGAQTGDGNVDLEFLWYILYDYSYKYFGRYGPNLGSVFPEYTPDVTIHRVASVSRGYEYYCRYEPAFTTGGLGYREGGGGADSQFAYPSGSSEDQQILVQRALYKATVEQLRRSGIPHVSLALTTVASYRPPQAGDLVLVDYIRAREDRNGVWLPARIYGQFRVMRVVRHFDGEAEPYDEWLLSNVGKYEQDDQSLQADQVAQLPAIQIVEQTTSSVAILGPFYRELDADADHGVECPIYILPTIFRVQAAYITVYFYPFRQPLSTVTSDFLNDGNTTIPIQVGAQDILLPTHANLDLGGTFNAAGTGVTGTTDGFDLVQKGQDNDAVVKITVENDGGTLPLGNRMNVNLHTPGGVAPYYTLSTGGAPNGSVIGASMSINFTKAKTQSTFTAPVTKRIKDAGATIAKIASQTILAVLPKHFHPIPPGIKDLETPKSIGLEIDDGSGVFVDRSAFLIDVQSGQTGPWEQQFTVECSRFINSPGKTVRLRFYSVNDPSSHGRGALCITGTILWSNGGIGQIAQAGR